MLAAQLLALALAPATAPLRDQAVHWSKLKCPTTASDHSCTHTNANSDKDEVVALFFQVELNSTAGEKLGSVLCSTGEVVHCHRSWIPQEGGSSGSCWWIQPAGTSFTCTGEGTLHFIGSNVATLPSKVLSPTGSKGISCLGGSVATGGVCKYKAGSADEWVSLSFEGGTGAKGLLDSFACTHSSGQVQPCSYSLNTSVGLPPPDSPSFLPPPRGSSCTFLLPAASELDCKVSSGTVNFKSAHAVPLLTSVYGAGATPMGENYTCPDPPSKMYPDRHGKNPCNCGWANPYVDRDIAIAINGESCNGSFCRVSSGSPPVTTASSDGVPFG